MPEPRLIPPPPDHPPTIGQPTPAATRNRLPHWWAAKTALPAAVERAVEPEPAPLPVEKETAPPAVKEAPTEPEPAPARPYQGEIRAAATQIVAERIPDPLRRRRILYVTYNGAAAAAGWAAGIGPWMHESLMYYGATDTANGVWVGCGVIGVTLVLEMRTHGWRDPGRHPVWRLLGWSARIPLASAVLALALYGPDASL